jgi:hypothetical protein
MKKLIVGQYSEISKAPWARRDAAFSGSPRASRSGAMLAARGPGPQLRRPNRARAFSNFGDFERE